MRTCARCGKPISRGESYYQQVTAWVANEKRDSVTLRQDVDPPRFAHRACITLWQAGIHDDQAAML